MANLAVTIASSIEVAARQLSTERNASLDKLVGAALRVIVDAGIGLPSHACQVMEWGFDGVLLNTAVSRSLDPVRMASAFAEAVKGGHSAFLAGPIVVQQAAVSSTPEIGRPFTSDSSELPRSGASRSLVPSVAPTQLPPLERTTTVETSILGLDTRS